MAILIHIGRVWTEVSFCAKSQALSAQCERRCSFVLLLMKLNAAPTSFTSLDRYCRREQSFLDSSCRINGHITLNVKCLKATRAEHRAVSLLFWLCEGKPPCTELDMDTYPRSSRLCYLARRKIHRSSRGGSM